MASCLFLSPCTSLFPEKKVDSQISAFHPKMSSSRSSTPSIPFKSKKPLQSTPKSKPTNSIATQTPDKQPVKPPPRRRNRGVALSVSEIRAAAQGNRDVAKRNQTEQVVKSARRQISSWPDDPVSGARKLNAAAAKKPAEIPEKYEMLADFFDRLQSSIQLLRSRGSKSSFTNISPIIESLTNRRFSHWHLAQMKYIMPEAIEIMRVLTFDERSSCMKPDLHVSINVDAIESDEKLKSLSKNLQLRKVFRSCLADFYKAHPQGDEIPEALLPEPFNRSKQVQAPNSSSFIETSTDAYVGPSHSPPLTGKQQPAVASHFSGSFRRHFSQKSTPCEPVNGQHIVDENIPGLYLIPCDEKTSYTAPSATQVSSSDPGDDNKSSEGSDVSAAMPVQCITATPRKEICSRDGDTPTKIASVHSTPAKLVSTPSSSTPISNPQKRCYMSPDDGPAVSENKLVRRPLRTRSLKFETPLTNVEDEVNNMEDVSADDDEDDEGDDVDDVLSILPKSLLQSIKEKERKAQEERDPAISQAKRRRQMIACLPKLFNMIHFLIQSLKRSVITKAELMHKIIASHFDIVDSREIEEQLNLLLELAPEWISQKLSSSGDLIFCINKMSCVDTIRARLEEAK